MFTTIISLLLKPEVIVALTSIFVACVTYIVSPYISEHAKKLFNKVPDKVKIGTEEAGRIYNKLDIISNRIGCDKIWISEFHNGGNSLYNAKSIKKFTMMYEHCNCSIPSTKEFFKDEPIQRYYSYINQIINEPFLSIDFTRLESPKYDMGVISYLYGIKKLYSFPIYSVDDILLGILGVEFIETPTEMNQDMVQDLIGDAGALGVLLSN